VRSMVSIIIPVYNVKEYLAECVESVRRQTLKEIEILLVDDGSTDGSAQICDAYADMDKRILVIHQENGGSTKARNAGLRASRGEYIGFVDSDDFIEPNMYEELLAYCIKAEADMAASVKYINHGAGEYPEKLGVPAGIYEKGSSKEILVRNLIYSEDYRSKGISPNLYDKLFKRDLLLRNQSAVDERIRYGEDDICVYSCLLNAERVVMVDRAYYHYRLREGSICRSKDPEYFERITWFYRQMKEEFEKHSCCDSLLEQLNRYMLEFVLRGINRQFGFGYGVVVPFYLPPYEMLKGRKAEKIILYGAGQVGQDYFRAFGLWGSVEITAWIDRQWRKYQKKGLPVTDISVLDDAAWDIILIAAENSRLVEQIKEELLNLGIPEEKILYKKPQTMIQNLGQG
jgi:glycosyltransferase involved in cell wall biosynthesis